MRNENIFFHLPGTKYSAISASFCLQRAWIIKVTSSFDFNKLYYEINIFTRYTHLINISPRKEFLYLLQSAIF